MMSRRKLMMMMESLTEYTTTGNPATFNTNVAKPLKQMLIPFSPVQSGTGDPSPENIRPIAGWTGIEIRNSNQNLLDRTTEIQGYKLNNVGVAISGSNYCVSEFIPVNAGQNYYFYKVVGSGVGYSICCYTAKDASTFTNYKTIASGSGSVSGFYEIPAGVRYIRVCYFKSNEEVGIFLYGAFSVYGYANHQGNTYSVTFPAEAGTVYGGTLDLTTGVLTVDIAFYHINDFSTWSYYSSGGYFRTSERPNIVKNTTKALCSCYKTGTTDKSFTIGSTGRLIIRDSDYTNANTWLTAVGDETLCYELSTPQTYQLTPQQIQTLIGDNVIWSDTNGMNTIKYLKKG